MNKKWLLFSSVFQLVIGLLGVIAFIVLSVNGENTARFIVAMLLGIAYAVMGIIGIITYKKIK